MVKKMQTVGVNSLCSILCSGFGGALPEGESAVHRALTPLRGSVGERIASVGNLDPARLCALTIPPQRVDPHRRSHRSETMAVIGNNGSEGRRWIVDAERAPVMADVARLAGVSHQTVSRVLHNHPNVRSTTRDRVLAAVRELGYRPNAAARTLATRRTRTLGVISFNTTLYGPACMLYGIEQAARQHEYFVTVAAVGALDRRSVLDAVDRLRGQGVEGIIVIAPQSTAVAALANVPPDVPLVAVGCGTHTELASVAVDNEAGAELATNY